MKLKERISILFAFVLVCLFSSCKVGLNLSAHIHHPYCGGAQPTPEMLKGNLSAMDTVFIIKKTDKDLVNYVTNQKVIPPLTILDNNGKIEIQLKKGEYHFFMKDKLILNNNQFIKKYSKNDKWHVFKGNDCLLKWKSTPDQTINLDRDKSKKIILKSKCFVGLNPCLNYTGPLPP
ncbi:MAG: hypothetical protein P8I93_08305 [Crocinitomicaceae bacterium]|nr:hypothetical protein [Crocinitomicaceae bacterium]